MNPETRSSFDVNGFLYIPESTEATLRMAVRSYGNLRRYTSDRGVNQSVRRAGTRAARGRSTRKPRSAIMPKVPDQTTEHAREGLTRIYRETTAEE